MQTTDRPAPADSGRAATWSDRLRSSGRRVTKQRLAVLDAVDRRPHSTAQDVVAAVREVAPHLDTSDPRWLRLTGPDHQIEIALGKGIRVHALSFYIARGDGAVPLVLEVCRALGVTPFDTETGEVLTPESRPPASAPVGDADDDRPWWRRLLSR